MNRWQNYVERASKLKAFHLKISALVFLDLFVFIVPSDVLISLGVALRPKEWKKMLFLCTIASVFAGFIVSIAVEFTGPWLMSHWIEPTLSQEVLTETKNMLQKWGGPGLAFVTFTPLPPSAGIVLYILGGGNPIACAFWLGIGRFFKYLGITWIASKAVQPRKSLAD